MRRLAVSSMFGLAAVLAVGAGFGGAWGSAAAAPQPPPSEPASPVSTVSTVSMPLVVVPAGCVAPPAAQAVFVGTLVAAVPDTARFRVEQVRAGSVDGFVVDGLVDVRYEDETRFLDTGETYLVGAGVDVGGGQLWSKVREPAPLFGGNDVVGVDDSDVVCPEVGDPIRTILPDGSSVDTGVFSPLTQNTGKVVRALVLPLLGAVAIVLALAAVKALLAGAGRGYGALARRALRQPVTAQRRPRSQP